MTKFYKQNNKTSGDRWAEGSSETDILHTVADDGNKAARDISTSEFKKASDPWDHDTWKPGPVKQGRSPPRYAPKGDAGTKQADAYEPSGKYKKPGGSGQRSGQ